LLVEDHDTRGVVSGLMGHHIVWGKDESSWPVMIEVCDGGDDVLEQKYLKQKLKESGLKAIGLIVDAEDDLVGRWDAVRTLLINVGGRPPKRCQLGGYIEAIKGKQVGVWIMPDNKTDGMVENFCRELVPDDGKNLWNYAVKCAEEAKAKYNAPYTTQHTPKANIYTWLAWQDPPGLKMGQALTAKILHHGTDEAKAFVEWFKKLFGV
jgi:hypothetical protein